MKTQLRTRVLIVATAAVCLTALISFGSVRTYVATASTAVMSIISGQRDIAAPRPAQSRSIATADLDANGTPDVAVGFTADDGTGVIEIYRGNPDAFAPTDDSVFVNIQNGYRPASLLGKPATLHVPESADFLQLGDFDQDGIKDVLCAARDGNLYLLAGDVKGRFLKARQIDLPGPVTALSSGEFGSYDGRDDAAVGVSGPDGYEVLIYDGATGGFNTKPMQVLLTNPATAIEFGGLDDDPYQDLAVANGSEITVVHGQSHRENLAMDTRIERVEVAGAVRGLSIGEFAWDRDGRSEMAALSYDGTLHIIKNAKLDERPFSEAEAAQRNRGNWIPEGSRIPNVDSLQSWRQSSSAGWAESKSIMATSFAGVSSALARPLVRVNYSYRETNDLMMLGQDQGKLEIVRSITPDEKARGEFFAEGDLARKVLDAPGTPVAVLQLPKKINGESDLIVLSSADTDIGVISFAPNTTITVDRTDDNAAASACTAALNDCSLRGAMAFANNVANNNTTINIPAGTYILSINGTTANGCGDNSTGDLSANQTMTIVGAGAATTIIRQTGTGPANDGDRIMCMNENFLVGLIYNFSAVTFVGGRDGTAAGTGSSIGGGGIIGGELNNSLTLTNVVFANNQVTVLGSGNIGGGGLQITGGSMTITNSTFGGSAAVGAYTDRTSTTTGNLNAGSGGGVMYTPSSPQHSGGSGTLTVTGCTFSRNNSGSISSGGGGVNTGIFAFAAPGGIGSGSASIGTSTFSNNQATTGNGGGLLAESLTTTVATTSFTNNSAGASGGAVSAGAQLNLNGTSPSITMTGNTAPRGSSVSSSGPVSLTGTNTTLSGSILIHSNGSWTNGVGSVVAPTDVVLEGGTLVMNDSTMNVAGNISIGPTQNNLIPGGFNGGSGTMNLGGNLSFNNTAGTSFTGGTGTINFNGTGAQSITNNAIITFFNLTDSNVTNPLTANNSFAVGGTLNVNGANAVFAPVAGAVISGAGTLTGNGTARVTRTAATADFLSQYTITNKTLTNLLVDYVGVSAQILSAITYGPLRINNGAGVSSAAGTATVNGQLTLQAGALNVGTSTLVINNGTTVGGGSITSAATGTVNYNQSSNGQNVRAFNYGNLTFSNFNKVLEPSGTIGIAGVFTTGTATGHTITGSTINFNGAGAQTIPAFNYNNLTSSSTGARTLANSGTIGVAGVFTPGTNAYTVTGSTVDYNSAGAQTVSAFNYNNLTSSNGGARTLASSGTIGIAGVWTPGASSYTITGSTIDFNGTGAQSINAFNYNNLTISGARGANNVTLPNGGTIGVAGAFSPTASFAGGAYVITGNTFVFNGSSLQSIPAFTFNNLTLNNAAGANLSGNVTVNGLLTLQAGNLGVGTNTLLVNNGTSVTGGTFSSAATGTVNYGQLSNGQVVLPGNYGNLTFSNFSKDLTNATIGIAGVFTPGSAPTHIIAGSTIDFNGSGAQTIPAFNYNNLTSSSTGARTLANAGTIGVAGVFTPGTNAYTVTGSTVDFNGSGSQTIPAFGYNNLTSSNTGARTLANAGTIGVAGVFTPGTNVYTITGSTIDFNGAGAQGIPAFNYNNLTSSSTGARTLAGAGVIGIAGTFTPGTNAFTVAGSTVDYNGGGAQTIAAFNYNHLTSSNSGARTLANAGTIGVAGNFTPGSNAYTITGSTINFNGTGPQNIPAFNYNNLTSSSTGARTLANSGTIGVAGTFTPGANVYTVLGSTISYNGAAQPVAAFLYNNLSTAGSGIKSLTGAVTVSSNLIIGATTTLDVTASNFALNIGGNFTNNGTFDPRAGTVTFNGSTGQSIGGSVPTTFNNLIINDASGVAMASNVTVNSLLTLTAGTFNIGINTLTLNNGVSIGGGSLNAALGTTVYGQSSPGQVVLAGSYNNLTFSNFNKVLPNGGTIGIAGTFTPGTATGHTITGNTIDFNGTGAQTVPAFSYNNLTVSGARGGATVTLASGTINVAGTFGPTATGVVYSSTGNTFVFNGGGAQTIPAFASFNNLSTATGGTKTLGGNAAAAGALTISTGTTLDCGGFGLNVGGNIVADGTFTCPTGTLTIVGPGAQTLGGTTPITLNNLVMNSAGGLTLNFNTTVNGILTLQNGEINTGANTLVIGATGSASRTSGHVVGTMQKVFGGAGAFTFHVGTAGVYSPVDVNMTAGSGALSIKANAGTVPSTPSLDPAKMLQRYWTLNETGDITANSVFHYLQTDVPVTSNETQYGIFRVVGGTSATRFNADGVNYLVDSNLNTFTVNNMSVFSDWTAGDPLAPTAAAVQVAGRVLTAQGVPVMGARVTITRQDGTPVSALTNQFGNYLLSGIEVGQTYIVTVRHKEYRFAVRTLSILDEVANYDIYAEP